MGTVQTPAILPQVASLQSKPVIKTLESKIATVREEMDFYHKLLSWLLFSCHEEKRYEIESFRKELKELRSGGFSALCEGVERLKHEMQGGKGGEEFFMDIAHLHLYFDNTNGILQALKTRIHRGFSDFTHVCIW